jgi:hypothetical protein
VRNEGHFITTKDLCAHYHSVWKLWGYILLIFLLLFHSPMLCSESCFFCCIPMVSTLVLAWISWFLRQQLPNQSAWFYSHICIGMPNQNTFL